MFQQAPIDFFLHGKEDGVVFGILEECLVLHVLRGLGCESVEIVFLVLRVWDSLNAAFLL